ncbi:MAG: Sb-PDE family phosphodiesterase [Candidatus Neomarinimicrobiota bacterium]|nr:Sb-PDE family phosphodiesterase [Candidatus Neomarinimicrobiota bacterium]MEC7981690.1 Sb-PDE family phosphodiesterase [Candidatus Neomarinimicrobiota bacterium]|tara:strand:- start:12043 stop:13179 length:1137 start_codon:yes stop_codon:yes gene_type:complete
MKYFHLIIITFLSTLLSQEDGESRMISFPDIKGFKTIVCDLHTHTVFSDGSVWPNIRIQEALKDGLDAIAITEHIEYQSHKEDIPHLDRNRSYELSKKYAEKSELMVIAGTEITKSMPPGHSNAIFVKDVNKIMHDNYMDAHLAARKQGAFIFWNHPHWIGQRKDGSVKLYEEVKDLIDKNLLHGIEVTNERTYSDQAIQVALDHNLTMLGTSDVHGFVDWDYNIPHGGHRPVTLVFSKRKNLKDLKRSLFQGRTAVWYNNLLIGKSEWIKPLLEASIKIDSAGYYSSYELGVVKIKNVSDARFVLKNVSEYDFYQNSDLIEIDPHSTKQIAIVSGKNLSNFDLEFEVLNAVIAPSIHPTIRLRIKNVEKTQLYNVKF